MAISNQYGSLIRAIGLPVLLGAPLEQAPPPAVVTSTMAIMVNVLGILAGAVVLVMSLIKLYAPAMTFDPLLMKNLVFFFGQVFMNVAIYMAVIAVYELLPIASGRPWKSSQPFLAAWVAVVVDGGPSQFGDA